MSPHLCEILIAILSVHPSVTFRCSKNNKHIEKQTGAKRSQSGANRPVSGRNVQVAKRTGAKRPRGETSKGRNVQGAKRPRAKRPVKGRNVQGAKRQRGETSCYPTFLVPAFYLKCH